MPTRCSRSRRFPPPFLGEEDEIDVSLDGMTVKLPHALLQPDYRDLFDRIVDWAYDEALDA
jgi:hypothetical protein